MTLLALMKDLNNLATFGGGARLSQKSRMTSIVKPSRICRVNSVVIRFS